MMRGWLLVAVKFFLFVCLFGFLADENDFGLFLCFKSPLFCTPSVKMMGRLHCTSSEILQSSALYTLSLSCVHTHTRTHTQTRAHTHTHTHIGCTGVSSSGCSLCVSKCVCVWKMPLIEAQSSMDSV